MADPTLSSQFQDFIVRVAEYLGIAYYGADGKGIAQVPLDAHDLDLCKRLVNDGYDRFIRSNPRWQFLTPTFTLSLTPGYTGSATSVGTTTTLIDTVRTEGAGFFIGMVIAITHAATGQVEVATITNWNSGTKQLTFGAITTAPALGDTYTIAPSQCVNGDNSRYYMPDGFNGTVLEPLTYAANAGHGPIVQVREDAIRSYQATASITGNPTYVGFRPTTASVTSNGKRWEAIFWPTPSAAYVVTGRCRIQPDELVNLGDRTIAGPVHDSAVLACALQEAERSRNDTSGFQAANAAEAVRMAINIDGEAAPRRLGDYGDKSESRWVSPRPWFRGVDTYNNNTI
jgi:hypothetical protein